MKQDTTVAIIGGGLSGLTLAWLLHQKNIRATVLEASGRLGGRIHTISGCDGTPMELGATWFCGQHSNLLTLLRDLQQEKFLQYSEGISLFQTKSFEPPQKFFVPASESPSYRVTGGTQKLTDALAQKLPDAVHLNTRVTAIRETNGQLLLETACGRVWAANQVAICIPPQLAAAAITFHPGLPEALQTVLATVQTWMAGAIKFTLEYPEPFWRKEGYSGMLYSHAGIISEMYDHTNFEENKFGFTGFLNGGAASYPPDIRKTLVLQQLNELLGANALSALSYFDKVWNDAFIHEGSPVFQRPHHNNGHPLLQESFMNEKLYFGGTETATAFPGYMEGAVIAAQQLAARLG
ncbi:FAD-dependent oxidoreductase [Niabella sp. CC-SYL272]|uniref:flavin monoamine oxidase family protein n=1 Tax=Niabella agricola TaxID=2891571 RepID=UPI001F260EFA|nr:NAD(P)/FAD-dependent oxidoreductase [Niabella agricola]MCF3108359.1 FAD-dependent oxidoreductase [Niabella agricola]